MQTPKYFTARTNDTMDIKRLLAFRDYVTDPLYWLNSIKMMRGVMFRSRISSLRENIVSEPDLVGKIFCSLWLDDSKIVLGTKLNRVWFVYIVNF